MLRVLSAHSGADTGGVGLGIAGAFKQHSRTVEVRSSVRSSNYIDYPNDLPWDDVLTYGARADVIHLHNTMATAGHLGLNGKPKVLHHHGTHYRENSPALDREVRRAGAVAVCSTLDLLDFADERTDLTWIPPAYDLRILPQQTPRHTDKLRVGHAPTNRAIKSTDAFLAACSKMPNVEPVLIEGKTWAQCQALKATCDAYFDQVHLGYGCNAIEAFAMGIPVIAGAQPSTLQRMTDTFGRLPFLACDETTIGDALKELADEQSRWVWSGVGNAHAWSWHDGRKTSIWLTKIYERLTND